MITQRLLCAWAGTDRLSALDPTRLARLPVTKASAELALFVAGVAVPAAMVDGSDPALVERRGDTLRARVALLPTARGVIACDRHDAADAPDRVCWPDDSSYHLARSIPPGRRTAWLDVGCGSAFAMLERPELADRMIGVELYPRAAGYARLGADLSGVAARFEVVCADAASFAAAARFELVTCNPPIPNGDGPIWRGASVEIVRAMLATAGNHGALVVAHAALELLCELAGDVVIVAYTPDGERPFGVAWWRPDGESRQIVGKRALTPDRPHIDWTDRDAALAGAL